MANWFIANLGTIFVCVLLLVISFLIILYMRRQKKKGKTACGCGCQSCPLSENCHKKEDH